MEFRVTISKMTYKGIKSLIHNIGKHCVNKVVVPQMTWRMVSKYFIIHSLKYQAKECFIFVSNYLIAFHSGGNMKFSCVNGWGFSRLCPLSKSCDTTAKLLCLPRSSVIVEALLILPAFYCHSAGCP